MNKQIIVNNLLISFSEVGAGAGVENRAIIFLHGWRSQKEIWNDVEKRIRELEKERVRLCALDFPGFGASQTPTSAMTVGDYAKIVEEFIKKLELKNVIIVGHSFGGRVGIKLAANYPESISKLVLVDSAAFAMNQSKKSLMAMAAKIVKPFFKPKFMQPLRKKIYQSIGADDYVATPELQQTFLNVVKEDLSDDLEKIHIPTLLVWGRNDKDTSVKFGERMYAKIHNSSLVILEHAGHFSFLDQTEKFVEVVGKFIA